jgi:hypothetical protein
MVKKIGNSTKYIHTARADKKKNKIREKNQAGKQAAIPDPNRKAYHHIPFARPMLSRKGLSLSTPGFNCFLLFCPSFFARCVSVYAPQSRK